MDEKPGVDLELLAYLEGYLTGERKARFAEVLSRRTRFLTVALEDVYQLHNASAVVRSCDVFGIQDAHLIEGRFGRRVDKKIAMGAQRWVDIHRYASSADCIEYLRSRGYRIVATTPSTSAVALPEFALDKPVALFFGTEKAGLTPEVLRMADDAIYIPMAGFTESLNISVSASLCLSVAVNKMKDSNVSWGLSDQDKANLRLSWYRYSVSRVDVLEREFRKRMK